MIDLIDNISAFMITYLGAEIGVNIYFDVEKCNIAQKRKFSCS